MDQDAMNRIINEAVAPAPAPPPAPAPAPEEAPIAEIPAPEDAEFDVDQEIGLGDEAVTPSSPETTAGVELDTGPEMPEEEPYPKPDYTVNDAVNQLKGLLDNWQEVRLNFPPDDPNREQVTQMGDILGGIMNDLKTLMNGIV